MAERRQKEIGVRKVMGASVTQITTMMSKEFLKLVLSRQIAHDGNPVLRWMADNVVARQDPAGNIKPDKSKSKNKIDGIVASIMALDRATRYAPSVYDSEGLKTL